MIVVKEVARLEDWLPDWALLDHLWYPVMVHSWLTRH